MVSKGVKVVITGVISDNGLKLPYVVLTLSVFHPDAVQSQLDSQGKLITSIEYNGGSNSYKAKYLSLFQYIILTSCIHLKIEYCIISTV